MTPAAEYPASMSGTFVPPPPPVEPAPAPATTRPRQKLLVGIVAALLVAAAAVFVLPRLHSDESNTKATAKNVPFTMAAPKGWQQVPAAKLASLPGRPLAVLKRADGKGLIVVNARANAASSLLGFSQQLDTQLAKRVPDF